MGGESHRGAGPYSDTSRSERHSCRLVLRTLVAGQGYLRVPARAGYTLWDVALTLLEREEAVSRGKRASERVRASGPRTVNTDGLPNLPLNISQ